MSDVGGRRDDEYMLTDADRTILDLAAREPAYVHPGAFEQAVVEATGLSVTRFWQRVNTLLDDPAAWDYAPVTLARLSRQRQARQRSRAARRAG